MGGGGGGSHIQRRGCESETLKRTLKRYQDPVLRAWLDIFFHLLEVQIMTQYISPVIFFSAKYSKRYLKSLRCEPFEHPKRYPNRFLTLTSTAVPFYKGTCLYPPLPKPYTPGCRLLLIFCHIKSMIRCGYDNPDTWSNLSTVKYVIVPLVRFGSKPGSFFLVLGILARPYSTDMPPKHTKIRRRGLVSINFT